MFVTLKLNENLQVGTIVCHDSNNTWRQALSTDIAPLGVIEKVNTDDDGNFWGRIRMAGSALARAGSASMAAEGGWLAVDDSGRAIIGASEDCGLVAPRSQGQSAPAIDDLILVYIR